ncbi:cyclic pyranopterin monophosphate synthaseaccessory protein [Striga asiatica]|uniref:Cyclic pyranopterin monophosphate synthaseaccessory protein n=1 Tax=Striga asiatica TaxID=4170 RepID=A0A5A7P975_STRAF|nr:cyclic pyranopterin monophosphate synthaseaccessory protein [Striga asiatica]
MAQFGREAQMAEAKALGVARSFQPRVVEAQPRMLPDGLSLVLDGWEVSVSRLPYQCSAAAKSLSPLCCASSRRCRLEVALLQPTSGGSPAAALVGKQGSSCRRKSARLSSSGIDALGCAQISSSEKILGRLELSGKPGFLSVLGRSSVASARLAVKLVALAPGGSPRR